MALKGKQPIDCSAEAAMAKGGEAYMPSWTALPRCANCGRPMRPPRGVLRDWPATVSQSTSQACSSCYTGGFRAGQRTKQLLTSERMAPRPVPRKTSRLAASKSWDELQHAVAWVVCSNAHMVPVDERGPFSTRASAVGEILDILGLFEEQDLTVSTGLQDPKGLAGSLKDRSIP